MTNPVIPPIVTNLPPAPLVGDTPEQFDEKAFPFAEALDPWGQSLNAAGSATRTNAIAAQEGAVESRAAAQESRVSASSAAAVSGAGKWVSGKSYAEGDAAWSIIDFLTYRAVSNITSSIDPSNDPVNWAPIGTSLAQLHAASLSF